MLMASQAGAALITGFPQDTTSPFYADFTATGLSVNNTWNSDTKTATFHVGTTESAVESYFTGSQAPGTQGNENQSFNGFYTLDATIQQVGSTWNLVSGTFTIKGDLMGGCSTDLLLQGSLKTGLGGQAFGYGDPGQGKSPGPYNIFQFLFTVTGGNSTIMADYQRLNNGAGGILLDAFFKNTIQGFDGNFGRNFRNPAGNGVADTFVPEPAAYAWAGAVMGLAGLVITRRKSLPGWPQCPPARETGTPPAIVAGRN
jgi:hypothetical protein